MTEIVQNFSANPATIDLESLELPQSYTRGSVAQVITDIEFAKPKKHQWVQVHPVWQRNNIAVVATVEEFGKVYVIDPKLIVAGEVQPGDYQVVTVVAVTTTQHVTYFWPLPQIGERASAWATSAVHAAEQARGMWTRVVANQAAGRYDIFCPEAELPAPVWPDRPLDDLFRVAIRDRYIATRDHAVIANLRGQF